METFTIVTVIAVILFARLGMRLLMKYRSGSDNKKEEDQGKGTKY